MRKALLAVHGLATLAALFNGLPAWGKIAALAVVGFSARHHLRRVSCPPVVRLSVDAEQTWRIGLACGEEIEASLLPTTVVTRGLALPHLRDATGRFHAPPILRDNLDADDYRRLCVRLRAANLHPS